MSKKSSTFAPDFDENHYLRRFYATRRDGGIGRHEGLKILWPVMAVWVQVPLAVLNKKKKHLQVLTCEVFLIFNFLARYLIGVLSVLCRGFYPT